MVKEVKDLIVKEIEDLIVKEEETLEDVVMEFLKEPMVL